MRILQVHKDFAVRGGASRIFFDVSQLLKQNGHEVAFFSTVREGNVPSPWTRYFIPYRSFARVDYLKGAGLLLHMIYSRQARINVARLLDDFRPDIVDLHSIYHQLSPSIIYEIRKRRIPTVHHVHDFHLIAPSHTLFHDGKICEITKKNNYYKAIMHKCVKNSYLASFADALEHYIHDATGIYNSGINSYIASSLFYKKKLIEYGVPENKIEVILNFAPKTKTNVKTTGTYVLYFGRLSAEKGLDVLLMAAAQLPHIPFRITGDGPVKEQLQQIIRKKRLHNVTLTGYQKGAALNKLIQNCRFVVLPTVCYENCPKSVLESFAAGKPVVASRIGGIPELITHKANGLLFTPANTDRCRNAVDRLWSDRDLTASLAKGAYEDAISTFGAEKHYRDLMRVYNSIVS